MRSAFRLALAQLLFAASAFAWSEPHHAITKGAIEVLPSWQKELLGKEGQALADNHCLIPDNVFTDKENAKFAVLGSKPTERYLLNLHLPAQQQENLETMRFFMGKAVESVQAGKIGDAARYMGTLCHQIEDYGSPSHTVPGDNMFTLLQQFLPPPDSMKDQLMHGPIESGEIEVVIKDYQPVLLGSTVEEAAWKLLHRVNDEIINARSTTIPIIRALYDGNEEARVKAQLKAATYDARVVADAFHTILCLGTQKLEPAATAALDHTAFGFFLPLEAASLYYPQAQFFSQPYWGHPRSGVTLEGGKKAVPLKLRQGDQIKEIASGISVGMGRSLTFHLPKGVYHHFTALAGLHPELGAKGRVEFTVLGDGKPLATATVNGTEPAHAFDCDISSVAELQLSAAPRGLDGKSNYAIWGDPTLSKTP